MMLKRSFIASGGLHVAVIAAASFAWPHAFELSEEPSDIIPVELMTVAETTNVAPKVVEQPPEAATAAARSDSTAVLRHHRLLRRRKSKWRRRCLRKSPHRPPNRQRWSRQNRPPAPPVPRQRPKPEPPQPQFSVDSVLALLESRAPPKAAPTPPPQAQIADAPQKGLGAQTASTLDLRDALLSQIRECWNVPVGAPTPEKLIVQVRVFLARDGSLAQPPLLEPQTRAAAASNPYMRTAAEAALRAVNVCEPYKLLPPDRYDSWREIVMTFDPSRMIGP